MAAAARDTAWFSREHLSGGAGIRELDDEVEGRLNRMRASLVPWLHHSMPLANSRVLEIGCGTGVLTVALAEQGAHVTAIDIVEANLEAAGERCRVYGLNPAFIHANATQVHERLAGEAFDMILFGASLEHMTHNERMASMTGTWKMLSGGSLWCLTETPNRLWFFDKHTAYLPFFMWLPDELAFEYARFSPRPRFRDVHGGERNRERLLAFLRHGRGMSYHEFALAMGPVGALDVVGSKSRFERRRNPLRGLLWRLTRESRYESFLARVGPDIHPGFYHAWLNLLIRK
jgi:S-adenosylmethionine-dependent methyltransferase